MARPGANTEELTNRLIEAAEHLLAQSQGRRLVLSDVAAHVGISQSYLHRFFPTKADLVRRLAQRWFAAVEVESERIVGLDLAPGKRLERWVLALLRMKRDRYDDDPQLFRAYLELAAAHTDLVRLHTDRLSGHLRAILATIVAPGQLQQALSVVEDATILFRTPLNIASYRHLATDQRAKAVVRLLLKHLG